MATYYVAESPTGVDSRTAVQAQNASTPWATVAKALNDATVRADASAVVEIRSTGGILTDNFFVNGLGTITIQNYPGENVVVQNAQTATYIWAFENSKPGGVTVRVNPLGGSLTLQHGPAVPTVPSAVNQPGGKNIEAILINLNTAASNPHGVSASSLPGVTFDGIVITQQRGKCIYAFHTGVIVRNCDLSHGSIGVMVEGDLGFSCPGVLIEDNYIHDMDKLWQDVRVGEGSDAGAMGVHMNKVSNASWEVRGNLFENNTTYSSQYVRDGAGVEPFRTTGGLVHDNEFVDNEIVMETGTASGWTNLAGVEFYQNYIHGDTNTNGNGPAFLIRTGNGNKVYDNTFIMDGGGRAVGQSGLDPSYVFYIESNQGGFGDSVANMQVYNNIIANTATQNSPGNLLMITVGSPTFTTLDYNLWWTPFGNVNIIQLNGVNYTQSQLTTWRANTPYGDHDIWNSDPLLNADGTLQATSPAVNAGVSGADIGAFDVAQTDRTSTDAVTLAQTGTRLFAGLRPVTGAVGLADSVARSIVGNAKTTADAVTLADSASSSGKNLGRYPVTNRS